MPTPTSTRWIDPLAQRIDTIRRAYNLCELQRLLYMLVATALVGGGTLLVTALFGSTRLFATVAWSVVAAALVTGALLVREATSRWLDRDRAVAWIERRGALGGRLRSLVELQAHADHADTEFFLPLLRAENERALPLWTPRRIVPRRVPRAALALALLTTAAFFAALTLTPVLHPRVPLFADPGPTAAARAPAAAQRNGASETDDDRSPLARLPADLQERIRQTVWGSAWDRVREARARAARNRRQTADGGTLDTPAGVPDGDEAWQLAARPPSDERLPEPGETKRRATTDGSDTPTTDAPPRQAHERASDTAVAGGHAGAGAGAGSSTSPDLYGAAMPPDLASRSRFELGLVTRMRFEHRSEASARVPPPRTPDQQPRLALSDRRDELAHDMRVPRAYEPIVRQVFAHRDAEDFE